MHLTYSWLAVAASQGSRCYLSKRPSTKLRESRGAPPFGGAEKLQVSRSVPGAHIEPFLETKAASQNIDVRHYTTPAISPAYQKLLTLRSEDSIVHRDA
ncbi:hypothetical protein LSAT2_009741 [Lamellibrachia satsuma]|nr:hypothetical protein LSAT2_009741 [Lamellibrachia satsuma]